LAVGITIAWWAKVDISPLFDSAEIRRGQLWRLFTAIFPHLDILHLAFNLYWLWILGTHVEEVYGHAKTAMLIALLAVGSSSLDFAFDRGVSGSQEWVTVYSGFFVSYVTGRSVSRSD